MEMISIEETYKLSCGIEDFIDKVSAKEQEEISCLLECLVGEEETEYSSVEIISNSCKIYKYYSEETVVAVQAHFTQSLQRNFNNIMTSRSKNGDTESELPLKKTTARSKRKTKRQTVVPVPTYNSSLCPTFPNHPYARPLTKPPATFVVPASAEMFRKIEPRHPPHYHQHYHGFHYGVPPCDIIKPEYNSCREPRLQSPYKAYSNGKTLIEVYSPTVGCGFNPRYNSLLIEPSIPPFLPLIPGQCPVNPPTDIQTFLHHAIEVSIPNSHDVRPYGN